MGGHEDVDAVVVVAAPVAGEVPRASAGDDGAGRQHLVEHDLADRVCGPPSLPPPHRHPASAVSSVLSQSMSRIPLMPAGLSASSSGPVMKPSSDIAMVKNTRDMRFFLSVVGHLCGVGHRTAAAVGADELRVWSNDPKSRTWTQAPVSARAAQQHLIGLEDQAPQTLLQRADGSRGPEAVTAEEDRLDGGVDVRGDPFDDVVGLDELGVIEHVGELRLDHCEPLLTEVLRPKGASAGSEPRRVHQRQSLDAEVPERVDGGSRGGADGQGPAFAEPSDEAALGRGADRVSSAGRREGKHVQ